MRRTIALTLAVVAVLAATALLSGCGCQDQAVENTTGKIDVAKDGTLKAQILSIQTGIQAYVATNGSAPADATQTTLGGFVDPWPTNPYTNTPMKPGDATGDYVYTPGGGNAYTLAVNLSDGSQYTAP